MNNATNGSVAGNENIFTVPEVLLSAASQNNARTRFPSVLIDEAHQQAWTTRPGIAQQMNPVQPDDSSLRRAAQQLSQDGLTVKVNSGSLLTADTIGDSAAVIIPHFSDPRFERTIGVGSHIFTLEEIDTLSSFVENGGGLVILAEHENDKYGTNLNELLKRFGVTIEHTSVVDPTKAHNNVSSWVRPDLLRSGNGILARVENIIVYRAGTITLDENINAQILATTSESADPAGKPVLVAIHHGRGRVVVMADSDLFGDDSVDDGDHLRLFSNLVFWAVSGNRATKEAAPSLDIVDVWNDLKTSVTELRAVQNSDGSISSDKHDMTRVRVLVDHIAELHRTYANLHPHDATFHSRCETDLLRWASEGFPIPDYLDSLVEFRPDLLRNDGLEHVVILPMYTQNGNSDRVFEAVWFRTVWPSWIAELEGSGYDNAAFVPIEFVDFTAGYETHSAVLFPETVATRTTPKFHWGAIFCDREAARFRTVTEAAAELLHIEMPPAAELLLNDAELAKETYVLWDLVHDRTHMHGELPFDPFMIKQRIPYWMYAMEELRCDLNAYSEMEALYQAGVPHAPLVKYAILFDRLLRFPITGGRTKNYDGLVGQIIFAQLHKSGTLRWVDNRLSFDWEEVDTAISELHTKVNELYRSGIEKSRIAFWKDAHTLVSELVAPHPASQWSSGIDFNLEPRKLVDEVLADEFPLNMFYESLTKKLAPTIERTKGITL